MFINSTSNVMFVFERIIEVMGAIWWGTWGRVPPLC